MSDDQLTIFHGASLVDLPLLRFQKAVDGLGQLGVHLVGDEHDVGQYQTEVHGP